MYKQNESGPDKLEMWAGLESTLNRVGDTYMDQMERNGHATRLEDIASFAALGIKKMRYPILWERVAPQGLEKADWTWADERLEHLQKFEIEPIVGLVHHGSGPVHTCLVKPCFVTGIVEYAQAFARRYPWVEYYTPVNEPLTTARFSGLYGHWYPHGKDGATFARALLNQCKATSRCMQVIREVNPKAKLVLTEDLGKTYSTPKMAYQAALDNERRWLSMDLLTGKLTPEMPMWQYMLAYGIEETELQWFLNHPCPPDILGINHYPTSERYLDENLHLYPKWSHGSSINHYPEEMLDGNKFEPFADVDAIRVRSEGVSDYYVGHYTLLKETWERYGLPLAVTEVHLCGPREQQVAWLQNVWNIALRLREEGVDVRAITAWSLLGTYDWVNLVTRNTGYYEPGVFDVRGPQPRPTALARLISHLAQGSINQEPLCEVSAWWQRKDRFLYPLSPESITELKEPVDLPLSSNSIITLNNESVNTIVATSTTLRPVLIIGKSTSLGKVFASACEQRFLPCYLMEWYEIEAKAPMNIKKLLDELQPWAVVNASSYSPPDSQEAYHVSWWANTYAPVQLAAACLERNIAFVNYSSDSVFDGLKRSPYLESDRVAPINEYGHLQAHLESSILKANPSALAIRMGTLFNASDKNDFLAVSLRRLAGEGQLRMNSSRVFSSSYLPDLVHTSLDLLVDGERGLWHLVNEGATTWTEMVGSIAGKVGVNTHLLTGSVKQSSFSGNYRYTVLNSERGTVLPALEDALTRYALELKL